MKLKCEIITESEQIEEKTGLKFNNEEFVKYCKEAVADKLFKDQFLAGRKRKTKTSL